MQGCRLARLFGKSIMDFYARNQYFLMNTQPNGMAFLFSYGYDFSCIGESSKNEVKAVIYSSFFTE